MWILRKLDWWLIGPIIFLLGLSLVMLISLSSREQIPFFWFWRQLAWIAVGALVFVVFSFLDYRLLRNSPFFVTALYVLVILALILVLVVGRNIRGHRAWFEIGTVTVQPVEFAKVALILILAKYFAEKNIEIWRFRHIMVSTLFLSVPVSLVLLQPDWGSGLTLIVLWFGMVLLAGARTRQVLLLICSLAVVATLSWLFFFSGIQKARIISFLWPQSDPYGSAYNQEQAVVAVGSGGLFGKGLGQGSQVQLNFLPASRTDFMFAALAEELGFVGVLLLLAAFGVLFFEIGKIALESGNNFARLASLGTLILLIAHVAINVGMNLGLSPVVGIGLPFVSYGGSSLLALSLLVGILASIRMRT